MYYCETTAGVVSIAQRSGRWHVLFDEDSLSSYISPEQAAHATRRRRPMRTRSYRVHVLQRHRRTRTWSRRRSP
jgi:hypothetical protein